jgi:hypothetical protein
VSTETLLGALGADARSLVSARWDSPDALGAQIGRIDPLFPKDPQV